MPEGAEGEEAAARGVEEGAAGGALAEVVEGFAGAVIAAADSLQGFVFGAEAGVALGMGLVDAGDDVGQDAGQRDGFAPTEQLSGLATNVVGEELDVDERTDARQSRGEARD